MTRKAADLKDGGPRYLLCATFFRIRTVTRRGRGVDQSVRDRIHPEG